MAALELALEMVALELALEMAALELALEMAPPVKSSTNSLPNHPHGYTYGIASFVFPLQSTLNSLVPRPVG